MNNYTFKKIHWFNLAKHSKFATKNNDGYLYGVLVYDDDDVVNNIWYKTIKERKKNVIKFRKALKEYIENGKKK